MCGLSCAQGMGSFDFDEHDSEVSLQRLFLQRRSLPHFHFFGWRSKTHFRGTRATMMSDWGKPAGSLCAVRCAPPLFCNFDHTG